MNPRQNRQSAETLRQAQSWDNAKNHYLGVGLCHRCAAQAAWGHQSNGGGWNMLPPPCDSCARIIGGFPAPTTNPLWRKFDRGQRRVCPPAVARTPVVAVEDIHAPHSGLKLVRP